MGNIARYVNIGFVAVGLMAWLVFAEMVAFGIELVGSRYNAPLIGYDFRVADLAGLLGAAVLTIYLRRHEKLSTFAMEVGNELARVTWPSWAETRLGTLVVVATTIIISLILALFDTVWGKLSDLVYGAS
jgi:preprotein translocase SecE subunit